MMAENDPKRGPETETPRRSGASNFLIYLDILEARAGVEPTYTDLQSGA
jgi:hypothetical protein